MVPAIEAMRTNMHGRTDFNAYFMAI